MKEVCSHCTVQEQEKLKNRVLENDATLVTMVCACGRILMFHTNDRGETFLVNEKYNTKKEE